VNRAAAPQLDVRWQWLLALVFALALAGRLWGIDYGLPFSYWTDEYHELMRAMELGTGGFNFARTGKGGFYLLLFVEYGVYFAVLKLAGVVTSTHDFAVLFARDPSMFYLIGRTTAAVFGCITVAAVFYVSRLAYTTIAGLIAAFLLAINVLHVDVSHRIGVDIPMTMLATLALYFGLRLADDGRRISYVMAGLFAGLATTTKLPGILLLLPLLIAHTYAVARHGGRVREWIGSRDLWIAAGVFLAVLLVTNPGYLIYAKFGIHLFGSAGDALESDELVAFAGTDLVSRPNLYLFYLNAVSDSMSWPLFVVSLGGLAYAAWKRTRADVILVSYVLINYLAISSTSSEVLYYPRYALPIIAVLAILAGRALSDLFLILPSWRFAAGAAFLALVSAWPVFEAIKSDFTLTQNDTRTIAENWFEANVTAGATVLIEGGKTGASRESVPLQESRASLERRIAHWKEVEPKQAKFLEFKLAAEEGTGYELELVKLDEYAARGIDYFVVRPVYFTKSRRAVPRAIRLLEQLRSDPRVELLRRFEPESHLQPGPVVEIYRLQSTERPGPA
jgi:dolichyl-phosphate-mannose-protein mannosyltransferase